MGGVFWRSDLLHFLAVCMGKSIPLLGIIWHRVEPWLGFQKTQVAPIARDPGFNNGLVTIPFKQKSGPFRE